MLSMLISAFTFCVQAEDAPQTLSLDGQALLQTRRLAAAGDQKVSTLLKDLCKQADKRMKDKLWTVTDKTVLPPSGDKHDYISLATYYWPNPDTTNGLPYVARDGEKNPENSDYDHPRIGNMINAVHTLSLAYYLGHREEYSERAVLQVRAWFLDEPTRMNPHLKYAQLKKGKNTGSPIGIIDARELTKVIDGVALLRDSKAWKPEDETKLKQWFRDYLAWLTESEPGKKEAAALNNHGTWYDVQASSIALYTGNNKLAREICEAAKTKRIAKQIEPDGQQPLELARTLSLTYTLFNLEAFFRLGCIAAHTGVDLWNYRTADGRSIRTALDWTIPYATGKKEWKHRQIKAAGSRVLVTLLRQAAVVYKEPEYEKLIGKIPDNAAILNDIDLLYPPAVR